MKITDPQYIIWFDCITEGEDSDIDMAIDVLSELAQEESEKGEDQELFFFFGADVCIILK